MSGQGSLALDAPSRPMRAEPVPVPQGQPDWPPRCECCGGPASRGTGVRMREGKRGLWYCAQHLPAGARTGFEGRR